MATKTFEKMGGDVEAELRFLRRFQARVAMAGQVQTSEEVLTIAGQPRTYLTTRGPYRDEQGAIAGVVAIARDITERKRLEDALRSQGARGAELRDWITHNLKLVHMDHAMSKRPDELSGGMKQRVGIARALAMEPKVLLLDEPFGALDALTRAYLQDELARIVAETGSTVLLVTHDVDEAVLLSDRVVMMTNGSGATIGEMLPVPLERPRDRLALASDPRYLECRTAVLDFLYRKQLRKAA